VALKVTRWIEERKQEGKVPEDQKEGAENGPGTLTEKWRKSTNRVKQEYTQNMLSPYN
jgi:hypothetical protein